VWNDHPVEIVAAGRFAPAEDGAEDMALLVFFVPAYTNPG
jgi:hypothetical protein